MKNEQYKKDLAYLILWDYIMNKFDGLNQISCFETVDITKMYTKEQITLLDKTVGDQVAFDDFIKVNKLTSSQQDELTASVVAYTSDLIKVLLNSGIINISL